MLSYWVKGILQIPWGLIVKKSVCVVRFENNVRNEEGKFQHPNSSTTELTFWRWN